MNKHFTWFIFYVCCICGLLLTGCSDDESGGGTLVPSGEDSFVGDSRIVRLTEETEDFRSNTFKCDILAENGTIITRRGDHVRLGQESTLTFETGLKPGIYRLLCLKTPEVEDGDTTWVEFGLGCRVEITAADSARILDVYSKAMKLCGSGTEEDPFIISSYDHFKRLRDVANDQVKNNLLFSNTHFLQTNDIDMDRASWDSDHEAGWLPIGNLSNNPFRGIYDGDGHKVKNLWSFRGNSAGIGLFGFVENSTFKNVKMENTRVEGSFAVGTLLGSAVSAGTHRGNSGLFCCATDNGYVKGCNGSVGVGGLAGVVDLYGVLVVDSCMNNSTAISGSYGVGGILGASSFYSQTYVQQSKNKADVTSEYSCAGGIVGSADTIMVIGCANDGKITGATAYQIGDEENGGYGAGGIVGGAGMSFLYACDNTGDIEGSIGVGGIIGSTRIGSEELLFNNALVKSSSNSGKISGYTAVGGICGEAQFGCYAVYNAGEILSTGQNSYIGGIVGNTSISVVHNAMNVGRVTSKNAECAGGIIGKTTWGAIFANQNYGDMDVTANYAGGVVGLAGNYTMVNYCANMGYLSNKGTGPTGGIIGDIGDTREWSTENIVSCVFGSIDCVLGILGPVISVTGAAVEESAKLLEKCVHVLHIVEVGADFFMIAAESVYWKVGLYEMLTEEETELLEASLNETASNQITKVSQEMEAIRGSYALETGLLSSNLKSEVVNDINQNVAKVLTFYEASDENTELINYNLNHKREERYEELEHAAKTKEIVQKVIGGVCILTASVASAASLVLTAGGSAPAVAAIVGVFGSLATFVGGVNGIVEGATDFKNNAVIVSQCVNMGKISGNDDSYIGGIAGSIQQHVELNDCLNMGPSTNSDAYLWGGIASNCGYRSKINRSLNVGKNWSHPIAYYLGLTADNYYYATDDYVMENHGSGLTLDELNDPDSYDNWDINSENSIWQVTKEKGFFPLPARSEMEDPAE